MPLYPHLTFISELTSTVPQVGYGEYIYQVSSLRQKNEDARTDTVFLLISEVCDGMVSLSIIFIYQKQNFI